MNQCNVCGQQSNVAVSAMLLCHRPCSARAALCGRHPGLLSVQKTEVAERPVKTEKRKKSAAEVNAGSAQSESVDSAAKVGSRLSSAAVESLIEVADRSR